MADQKRTDIDWNDVRVFVALARHGSLSAVARALAVNHATVSRRIASLEQALGEKLVERRPQGYVLTSAGMRVLAAAGDMEAAAQVLGRQELGASLTGLVRVNAPPTLAQSFLVAELAALVALHPGLDIEVAGNVHPVSLERRETDIALRFGRPEGGDVLAYHVVTIGYGFYASPEWYRRINEGTPFVFVGFDETTAHIPDAIWLARRFPHARTSFRVGNQASQAAAARNGAGIALLPHFVAQGDDSLVPCRLGEVPPSRELWLMTRRQDRKATPIRTVTDFLGRIFSDKRELFDGNNAAPDH